MRELLAPDDTRDVLRKIGGLLLGLGALMLALRRDGEWGDFAIFLVYAIPAVVLYGGALASRDATGVLRPWQSVLSVFGLLFVPLALGELVELIGDEGDSGNSLNVFWIFGITAALAVFAAVRAGVRYQLLLASVAGLVSWIALWDKIIGFGVDENLGVLRGLFGIWAVILLVAGFALWRETRSRVAEAHDRYAGPLRFSELFTGAGIAAVISAGLGITAGIDAAQLGPFFTIPTFEAGIFWDTLLLLISLGLVAIGTLIGVRGPVYVGAIGLALFLFIAGLDLDSAIDTRDATKIVGWPLILLVVGAVAVALSLVRDVTLGEGPRRSIDDLSGRR
jgi:hypothetical protein